MDESRIREIVREEIADIKHVDTDELLEFVRRTAYQSARTAGGVTLGRPSLPSA